MIKWLILQFQGFLYLQYFGQYHLWMLRELSFSWFGYVFAIQKLKMVSIIEIVKTSALAELVSSSRHLMGMPILEGRPKFLHDTWINPVDLISCRNLMRHWSLELKMRKGKKKWVISTYRPKALLLRGGVAPPVGMHGNVSLLAWAKYSERRRCVTSAAAVTRQGSPPPPLGVVGSKTLRGAGKTWGGHEKGTRREGNKYPATAFSDPINTGASPSSS